MTTKTEMPQPESASASQNWLLGLAVLAALVVLMVSVYSVLQIRNSVRAELHSLLISTLDNTLDRLRDWEKLRRSDLELWASDAEVVSLVGVLLSYGDDAPELMHDEAELLLSPALRTWDGKAYSVVSLDGTILTSSKRYEIGALSPVFGIPGFVEHIKAGQSRVSKPMRRETTVGPDEKPPAKHPYANGPDNKLVLYVGAPVRITGGGVIAIMVFELDPIVGLSAVMSSGQGRQTMETFAFSREGTLLSESRFNTQLAQVGLIPAGGYSTLSVQVRDPGGDLRAGYKPAGERQERGAQPALSHMAASAASGYSGTNLVGYRSYMGHEVIGAWTWAVDLDFAVGTEMEVQEAYATYFTVRWQIMVASILAAGLLIGLTVIFHTGRRRIGEGARRLESIMDNVLDGIIVINEQGVVETYNAAAMRIFGFGPSEVIGNNISMLMPEPHRTAHDSYLKRFRNTNKANILGTGREVTGQRKDGSLLPLDLAITEMNIHGRRLFLGVLRDITERKHAQEELRRSEQGLKTAQRIAKLGGWSWNVLSGDMVWSDEVFRIFGHRGQQFRPTYEAYMDAVHPDDRKDVQAAINTALSTKKPYSVEHRVVLPEGTLRVVFSQGEVVLDAWGEPLRIDGITHDITDRKEAERLKSEFVSTVSHELRTPLTSIHGSLGLLVSGAAGTVSKQCSALLDIAHKNTGRLVRLIDDILDVEKLDAGKMAFDMKPYQVDELLGQALEANNAYADKFAVKLRCTATVPGAEISIDADRFAQVMANLISNAVKYSPEGSEVDISAHSMGGYIRFSVTDCGPGIPLHFRDRLFHHFTQADSSDTRQKGGTGLGLSISKSIVERMGGTIGFMTEENQGTTFYFELKLLSPPDQTNGGADGSGAEANRNAGSRSSTDGVPRQSYD